MLLDADDGLDFLLGAKKSEGPRPRGGFLDAVPLKQPLRLAAFSDDDREEGSGLLDPVPRKQTSRTRQGDLNV